MLNADAESIRVQKYEEKGENRCLEAWERRELDAQLAAEAGPASAAAAASFSCPLLHSFCARLLCYLPSAAEMHANAGYATESVGGGATGQARMHAVQVQCRRSAAQHSALQRTAAQRSAV